MSRENDVIALAMQNPRFSSLAQSGVVIGRGHQYILALIALNEGASFSELQRQARWESNGFVDVFHALRRLDLIVQSRRTGVRLAR
jgi:hypothetical protein